MTTYKYRRIVLGQRSSWCSGDTPLPPPHVHVLDWSGYRGGGPAGGVLLRFVGKREKGSGMRLAVQTNAHCSISKNVRSK